jgi:signal transduction histidine kinase
MTGIEMIKQIKAINKTQRIIVTSAYDDAEYLIPLIEHGVDRFVMKPLSVEGMMAAILDVGADVLMRNDEAEKERTAGTRLRAQIEWLMYKDNRNRFSDISSEVNAIYNLKRSLNEAAGFGAMISIVHMIRAFAKQTEDAYVVKRDLMEMLFENNGYCARLVEGLDQIEGILKGTITPKPTRATEFYSALCDHTANLAMFLEKKGKILHISPPAGETDVKIDMPTLLTAMEELIINAAKYGEGADVNVYTTSGSGFWTIHVQNVSPPDVRLQFKEEFERLVLEPFFRMHPTVEGYSEVERLPIGLGLPIVNFIAQKHGGFFGIAPAVDHQRIPAVDCVISRLQVPLV